MSRIGVAALALAIACGAAQAQTPPPATPSVDPGTKLNFGATVGGANLERTVNHAGPPLNQPDQGASYYYLATPKRLVIAVQVYDGGRRVPQGSTSPIVTAEFSNELTSMEQLIKGNGYTNFERPPVPSSCTYGATTFRCITYGATSPTGRLYSKLLLTGYQGHFVKIRVDWSQSHQQSSAEAEAALQAFIPALMH